VPHLDPEPVVAAQPLALAGDRPDPGDRVPVHRQDPGLVAQGPEQLQLDRTRGGRPHRQLRPLVDHGEAELGVGGLGVQVVEDAGQLHAGECGDPTAPGVQPPRRVIAVGAGVVHDEPARPAPGGGSRGSDLDRAHRLILAPAYDSCRGSRRPW
jgi:hypothetical protein